jgi:hypothetical protein
MGNDISKATKGITNSTMVSKATIDSKVIVATILSEATVATTYPNNDLGPQLQYVPTITLVHNVATMFQQ